MSLEEIAKFYNSGRNKKALAIITKIADPSIEVSIFKCFILNRMSIDEAYTFANEILEKSRSRSDTIKFSALAAKVRSIGALGKSEWTLAGELIRSAESIFEKLDDATKNNLKRWRAELLYDKGLLEFMLIADKKSALSIINQCEIIYKELGDQRGMGQVKAQLGFIKYLQGNPNEAMKILEENAILTRSQQIWDATVLTLAYICELSYLQGDAETAIQKGKEAINLANEHNLKDSYIEAYSHRNLAIAYSINGQYESAIKEFNTAISNARRLGELHTYSSSLFYLADVERKLGDIDSAIDKFEESRIILEEIQDVNCLINANLRFAKALINQNDYQKAYQALVQAFEIRGWKEEQRIPLSIYAYPETLLELIIVAKELGKDVEVENYLSYFESFVTQHPTEKFVFQLNLARALIEKKSTRAKYRISAQNKFEELVTQQINDDELNTRAIINYCELLLEELRTYGEEEVLDEIITLVKKLNVIAERQKASPLKIEGLLLEGQLKLIQGEAEISMNKFNQAYDLATKYKLKRSAKKASMLIEYLKREIEEWEMRYHKNIPIIERIDESKIIIYINDAIKVRDFLAD